MVKDPFGALSATQRDCVRAALSATFGSAPIQSVTFLSGGATGAHPLRVEVGDRPYLVRVEGPASPLRNPHQYASMRMAAEAGIAPPVRYVDELSRVAITDFIAHQSLRTYPGGAPALARTLGVLLNRLQGGPVFPHFVAYPDIVARLFAHVRRTSLFAPGLLDPHVARLERMREAYDAGPTKLVSSHNDFIPSNILFDGKRLWAIDWESAYRNDPLVDVAIALDTLASSPELADVLLRAWLGRTPDEALLARLAIVRSLTRLYYAGVFLSASAAVSRAAPETDLSAPTLAEFKQAIRTKRLLAGAPQTKHILGKMFLASFLTGAAPPGFDAAV
jgi:hypothetical protein